MTTDANTEECARRAAIAMAEAVETPDRHRLARIEQQLLADRRGSGARSWRWIVLGFGLATGAVAAYWGVYGHEPAPPAATGKPDPGELAPEPIGKRRSAGAAGENAQQQDKAGEESPVIYIGQ